ncbi:MAG: nucleotide exchange factor GrpE [Alphaproteobacteria bacterium]
MSKNDNQNKEEEIFESEENVLKANENEGSEGENTEVEKELTVEEQLAEAKNNLLLALAEVQNMRKRTDEEIATARKYGVSPLARDLFSVADNLRMAIMSVTDEEKENNQTLKNLSIGLDMVSNEFYSAFEKNGIKQILPQIGDDFDHNQHQAMGEVESEEVEKGKIAQVLSAGYILDDRLLKPAMVNISK